MQNRYTGDIGDFSKLGLLRCLDLHGLTIGINWYLVPNETHTGDGCHVGYLKDERFKACDEKLWTELGKIVYYGKREIQSLQKDSILSAIYYSELLDFSKKSKEERIATRIKWHQNALNTLANVDIVCVDPDNGLIVPSAAGTRKENKYVLPDELADYYKQGSSIVYYQHKARRPDQTYINQHKQLLEAEDFIGAEGFLLKYKITSQRYYCFIVQPQHRDRIDKAVHDILESSWSNHFSLISA